MAAATLTSKGQITIPKKIRELLGVDSGDRLLFHVRNDGVIELEPQNTDLMSLCGILKPKVRGVSVEDMNETIFREAGRGS